MLTVASLISKVQAQVGDGQNTSADDAIYTEWCSEAIQVIWNKWKWRRKYVTATADVVAGVTNYDVPTTISDVISLSRSDGREIHYAAHRDLVKRGFDLTTSGEPVLWYWGPYNTTTDTDTMSLWRVPDADATYKLRGLLRPEAEYSLSDTIPLSEEFIPALKEYIRYKALEAEELFDASDRAEKSFFFKMKDAFDILAHLAEQERSDIKFNINNDLHLYSGDNRRPILFYPRVIGDTSES
jgi:hypothetical protein